MHMHQLRPGYRTKKPAGAEPPPQQEKEESAEDLRELFADVENPKQVKFLLAYVQSKRLSEAQRISHVHSHSHYKWLEKDPKYPAYFRRARRIVIDQIEEKAYRRAFIGRDMPIYYHRRIIGYYKMYADKLAIFLLKALRPEIYGANPDIFLASECPLKITIRREGEDKVYDNGDPLP